MLLGVSRATLYRSIKKGDFPVPVVQLNGRWRVARRAVERLLDGFDPADRSVPDSPVVPALPGICPTCGSSPSSRPRRSPMCAAARRSSSSTESV